MLKYFLAAALLACPSIAQAHAFFLHPDRYAVAEGEPVTVAFELADGEEISAWDVQWARIAALRLHGPDETTDLQASITTGTPQTSGGAELTLAMPGTHVLAFESNPSFIELPAAEFNPYVEEEGLTAIARAREAAGETGANGTELYARRAKALIQVGDTPTPNVTRPLGQTLEIVPLANPYALGTDRQLGVQLIFRGEPLAGATVHVMSLADPGNTRKYPTDDNGKALIAVPDEGPVVIDTVWSVPEASDERADYMTLFASLTFGYR